MHYIDIANERLRQMRQVRISEELLEIDPNFDMEGDDSCEDNDE